MKFNILSGSISRFLPQFFFPPDAGAGDGGGGGGGTGTIDPPAGEDPALAAANEDVLSYKAPGLDEIDFGEPTGKPPVVDPKAKAADDPAKAEADRKAAESKAADDKAAADKKAAEDKAKSGEGDLPVDKLREAYKSTKAELDALKETAAKGDPKVKELETQLAAEKKAVEDARKEIEDRKARDIANDPEVWKPLAELDAKYNEEAESFYSTMEKLDHPAVNRLLPKFAALKRGTEGYAERYEAFAKELNVALGAEEDSRHPSFDRAVEWVAKSAKFANQRNQLAAEIKQTQTTRYQESISSRYTAGKTDLEKRLEAATQVPEEMEKTLKTHPKVITSGYMKVLPQETRDKIIATGKDIIRIDRLGLPPRTEKDYAGMTPEQIRDAQASEAAYVAKIREQAPEIQLQGWIALQLVGPMQRRIAQLEARLGEKRADDPPDPAGEGKEGKTAVTDSLADWKPPSLDHMNY